MKNALVWCKSKVDIPLNAEGNYTVKIDGRDIASYQDFISVMEEKFKFPTSTNNNFNAYLDWIRDLSWFDYKSYTIIIEHAAEFMRENPEEKKTVIDSFESVILPFWESEVKSVVVCGEPCGFNVYLY